MARIEIDKGVAEKAINSWRQTRTLLNEVGKGVRDDARSRASSFARSTDGIMHRTGRDEKGVYADVGYDKTHRGFALWWHEVGNVHHPARPHLRPAAADYSLPRGRVTPKGISPASD